MIIRDGNRYLIEGPVTLATVTSLLADGGRSFEGDRPVVDFAKATEADSSALSLMLEWTRRLRAESRDVAFANLSPNLVSLANLYGVADLIPVAAE